MSLFEHSECKADGDGTLYCAAVQWTQARNPCCCEGQPCSLTVGRMPRRRAAPALPNFSIKCSGLDTWPTVAMHMMGTMRCARHAPGSELRVCLSARWHWTPLSSGAH